MKSSTKIAEKLGHFKYSQLIQDCFFDLNNPVISDQKVNYLSKHDIFILPSFEEGDSIALKEALASYLPVIISKQCRMDIVEDYNAGIVIDTNVESLYKFI